MTDPDTGLRPDERNKPSGSAVVDMANGIRDWMIIPSVATWERGKWYLELDQKLRDSLHMVKAEVEWETWVVSGEGTPGNFLIRCYVVPNKVGQAQDPKHPSTWSKNLKEKGDNKPKELATPWRRPDENGQYMGFHQPTPVPAKPTPPKPPPLPFGIRFRCRGCGHWWKESDLAPHSTHCCPGESGTEGSDWAILCECCDTLDEVSQCKPGFPLDKKEGTTKGKETEKEEVVAK